MLGHDKRSFWYNNYVILPLFGNYTVVWTAEKSLLQHNSLFPCRCDIQVWLLGKGRKEWQSVFLQERRHCIASFLSSNSFYKFNFSAFLCKERSFKQKREFMHLTSSLHDILLCTVYGCSMQHQIQIGFLLIIDTIKGHYDFIIQWDVATLS